MLVAVVYCKESAGADGGFSALTEYTMESSPILFVAVQVKFPDDSELTSEILMFSGFFNPL